MGGEGRGALGVMGSCESIVRWGVGVSFARSGRVEATVDAPKIVLRARDSVTRGRASRWR